MKKSVKICIFILITSIFLCPIKTLAKEIVCKYEYENIKFEYKIDNSKVMLSFNDGELINNKNWYYSDLLEKNILNASKTSNDELVCTTLVVEENESFNTVFIDKNSELCNGKCTTLNNKSDELSVVNTKKINAVGLYNSTKFFIPTIRLLSNEKVEWSIDSANYYDINKSISIDNNSKVSLDKSIIDNVFTNDTKMDKIYRCVSKEKSGYSYNLALDSKTCENIKLSNKDNQLNGSKSLVGDLGANNCDESLFGDVNTQDTPAWIINKILKYFRIIAPMIVLVLSALDFAKALISSDDEVMQKNYKKLISRLILILALYFVPLLVDILLQIFGLTCGQGLWLN